MDRGFRKEGVPLVPAVCKCGHRGKSGYPEHYRCSVCYNADRAAGELRRAAELEARARKLRDDAARHQKQSEEALRRRKGMP